MGAERSSESTRVQAAPPVAWHSIDAGENATVFAKGLCSRGYEVKGWKIEYGEFVKDGAEPGGGKIETTAPKSVYDEMAAAFANRAVAKKK